MKTLGENTGHGTTFPLISCVVSVFNGERYLRQALSSIVAQTYRPIEVIVADDGSTDDSHAIATSIREPVRLVTQATAGPAATRNLGLDTARGEFVAFLDADDLWHPEKLASQADRFRAWPELELCVSHVQMFWGDVPGAVPSAYRDHPRSRPVPGYATTAILARRRLFDRIGRFRTELWFSDAAEWFIRARRQGTIMEVIPETLTYHRMHAANLTSRRSAESRDEFLTLMKEHLDFQRRGGAPRG